MVADNIAVLRTQYVVSIGTIYFPAALKAAAESPDIPLTGADRICTHKFFESIIRRIASTSQYLQGRFHPLVWTQAQAYTYLLPEHSDLTRLYATGLTATVLLKSANMVAVAPPKIIEYLEHAVGILEMYGKLDSSIQNSFINLQTKVAETKIEVGAELQRRVNQRGDL
jgi:hypothetical protein